MVRELKQDPIRVGAAGVAGASTAATAPTGIRRVEYVDAIRAFLVWMARGKVYLLPLGSLLEADKSAVVQTRIGRGRHHFKALQQSGNSFYVPWDIVLYHCEPEYEYYKGRAERHGDRDRAKRIGQRVRALRLGRGMTVSGLAGLAGMKRPNLSRMESGRHTPSLETLERIAAALGVPVADLVAEV